MKNNVKNNNFKCVFVFFSFIIQNGLLLNIRFSVKLKKKEEFRNKIHVILTLKKNDKNLKIII